MRMDRRVRGFGALVAAAAVPVFILVSEPLGGMLAFALAVTGLFVAVVVAERVVPAEGAEALVDGDATALAALAEGLDLGGRPVYVPDQGNVGAERLFLPASEGTRPVPVLDADTVAYAGTGGTRTGVAIPPPGLALVDRHEHATGTRLKDAAVPEAEAFLGGLAATHDLARNVRVTEEAHGFRVRFAAAAVTPPCFRDPARPLCERTGCALCQATGCALARSLGHAVEVRDADVDAPWVTLHYRKPEDAT